MKVAIIVFSVFIISCTAQRPTYLSAGGYGYPTITTAAPDTLGNRFGEDGTPTTTMRLPIEAMGDAELVKRLLKLPIDQQPFWLLNWKALEADRANPHTYEIRENNFIDFNRLQ